MNPWFWAFWTLMLLIVFAPRLVQWVSGYCG
jgi:hypothetical protein